MPEIEPEVIAAYTRKLFNIQALRCLAAMMVVVAHLQRIAAQMGFESIATEVFSSGVDLFFVVSGFIMVYTTRREPTSPGRFLVSRIIRLAPLYWLFTLLAFLGTLLVPQSFSGTVAAWPDLFRSLLFIPYARADGMIRPLLFVGWSLNLEMMFYALFAISLILPWAVWREAALVAVLAALVIWHVSAQPPHASALTFLTQPLILQFALGMLVGTAFSSLERNRLASGVSKKWGVAAAAAVPLLFVALLWCGGQPVFLQLPATAWPATALLLVALLAERSQLMVTAAWIQAIGDASYALYLCHPFITQAITLTAVRWDWLKSWTAPLLVVLALTGCAQAAIVIHRYVERPMIRLAHRLRVSFSAPL